MMRLVSLITAFAVAIQASGLAVASSFPTGGGDSVSVTIASAGQLTDIYNQKNEHEVIEYTDRGWVWKVTNGRSKVRTYTYTDRGEIYYYSLPVVSINTEGEIWTHDGNGNATAHGYFKAGLSSGSETKSYTYDVANRMTLIDYNTGSMTNVSFDWDDADRKIEMVDGTGTTAWTCVAGDAIFVL